jgi:hypothetical protein
MERITVRHCPDPGLSLCAWAIWLAGVDMADHMPNGSFEMGAEMDYSEHEKTYSGFLTMTKYSTLVLVALMVAMAFGFFGGGGFISAIILFAIICGAGTFFLRSA